jgi:hypothetical protein
VAGSLDAAGVVPVAAVVVVVVVVTTSVESWVSHDAEDDGSGWSSVA